VGLSVIEAAVSFIQAHKPYFDAAHAMSSVVNLIGWTIGGFVLAAAWRRNAIQSVQVGPLNFRMQEAAVEAAATAARDWQAKSPSQKVDVPRIRATIEKAFSPAVADNLIGKSILWVDDNPQNNLLAVRALTKLQLEIEQVTSTEFGLAAMQRRHFDLIISDMGRGDNMTAGYELLAAVRAKNPSVPFLIFASADTPEYRRDAKARGAQLSTNDMLELIDTVVAHLGRAG
jgi:CheY-like chemotaxis protein